jgi:oligopeptide/dipeptide ABC transporter ATP-binding protein
VNAPTQRAGEAGVASQSRPVLAIRDLRIDFATANDELVHAVQGVSIDVRPGEILGLVGESGSGKSVTAASVLGILPQAARVRASSVMWNGEALSFEELHAKRGRDIAIVFQNPMSTLDPLMPVGRQISEVLRKSRKLSRSAARVRAVELLDLVGIPDPAERSRQFPFEFSGGMAQRVAIALAIAPEPALLIADEPTTALDVTVQAQVVCLLQSLQQTLGLAVIFITHDLGVIRGLADRCVVMYGGRVAEDGSTEQLFERAKHPYTAALIAATPDVNDVKDELKPIPGDPAVAGQSTTACAFAPRCAFATEVCRTELPMLRRVDSATGSDVSQRVACWHIETTAASVTSR